MAERPILFNGAMVRAILAGQKTQTRRAVKLPDGFDFTGGLGRDRDDPVNWGGEDQDGMWWALADGDGVDRVLPCPFGQTGDRLWVRETWAHVPSTAYRGSMGLQQTENPTSAGMSAVYAADWERSAPGRWRPSIHMPRWACRLVLDITDVRVERLQAISDADCWAEGAILEKRPDEFSSTAVRGVDGCAHLTPRGAFMGLWLSTGGDWAANPWVWVIGFKRVEAGHG